MNLFWFSLVIMSLRTVNPLDQYQIQDYCGWPNVELVLQKYLQRVKAKSISGIPKMYKFQNLPFMKIPSIQPCMDTLNINLFFFFLFLRGKLSSVLDVTNKWSCTYMCLPFLHVSGSTGEGKVSWLERLCLFTTRQSMAASHVQSPYTCTDNEATSYTSM